MDNLMGLGAALAAMRPDDGHRYEGTLMLSALPDAPTVSGRTPLTARLRLLLPWRRTRQPAAASTPAYARWWSRPAVPPVRMR